MSEVKVNKISPRSGTTVTLGDSGDTFTIPSGATITNNGTAAGFGATGAVSWDTTVKTTGFTAVSGVGYFVNTTAGIITVTLPASPSAGDVVGISDYAGTAATNNITIGRNGSNINGAASDQIISKANSAVTLVYVDGTQGWKATDTSNLNDIFLLPEYIVATGGTITCCGDYKIHTFTGPGTLCVSAVGNPTGSISVDYMVVAGGGGAGQGTANLGGGGGAGAGGFRESSGAASGCYSASPLGSGVSALPVAVQGYPIVVGSGGAGSSSTPVRGTSGNDSTFSTITSGGGGGGGTASGGGPLLQQPGGNGGSGGGAGSDYPSGATGGTGNTPPVSPSQGQPGGGPNSSGGYGSGGGGATVAGALGGVPGGAGGAGATTSINGTPTARAGGGGGGVYCSSPGTAGAGGAGGGGNGTKGGVGGSGTVNTGGGGGGGGRGPSGVSNAGGSGGSGIVIIRYKFQ